MPRNGRMIWLAATLGLISSLRAQDDLPPPPKTGVKSAPLPAPPDDLAEPMAPKRKPAARKTAPPPVRDSLDLPGVDLPSEPPAATMKSAPPSTLELPSETKRASNSPKMEAAKPIDRISFPDSDTPKAPERGVQTKEQEQPTVDSKPTSITLSAPVAAQSTRPRKSATLRSVEAPIEQPPEEKAIPAPSFPKKTELIASSLPPELRRAPKKTIDMEKTKLADEKKEQEAIIQAAAVAPVSKPQDQYELVQPRLPNYDVVHAKSSPRQDPDALRTVYESPEQLLRGSDGVVQTAAFAEGQGASIESYQVRIWKIDGWETFQELARMEYRDEALAASLAKYNRSGYRPTDPIPAGHKVRLPPKWVLERSGTTVARRPAPIKSDFQAPPATAVEGQPAGSGIVASSGDRSKPGSLVRENAASPLPKEKAPVETGPVFVVNEAGMTLYMVAKRVLGDGSKNKQIYDLNRDRLSSSQSELKIGTRLRMPEGSMVR
jgi:hypothetical protein